MTSSRVETGWRRSDSRLFRGPCDRPMLVATRSLKPLGLPARLRRRRLRNRVVTTLTLVLRSGSLVFGRI